MSLKIEKKKFNELTNKELYDIMRLRVNVFIIEQNILEDDFDDYDLECMHYFIKENDIVVSYARKLDKNTKFNEASIGRVVTHNQYRNKGYMGLIINEMIKDIKGDIRISAQYHLTKYYESFGFKVNGTPYMEAGILHTEMLYKI